MKMNTLKYLFKEGVVGLWRNRTMAFASVGTIVLCLLILGMSYGIGSNIDYVIEQLETKLGITVYLKEGLSEDEVLDLTNKVRKLPNISSVVYISKEDALKTFSEDNEDESLFIIFKEDNPLPASLEVTVADIEKQKDTIQRIEQIEGVDETDYFEHETDVFINVRDTVSLVCYGIICCLIIVGILLMSNTIKLTVYVRRKEINIMKYVGATDSFIRLPFLIEGVLIGFIGSLVSVGLIKLAYGKLYEMSLSATGILQDLSLLPTGQILSVLIPIFVGLGIGIGLIGSGFAIHKHLQV